MRDTVSLPTSAFDPTATMSRMPGLILIGTDPIGLTKSFHSGSANR